MCNFAAQQYWLNTCNSFFSITEVGCINITSHFNKELKYSIFNLAALIIKLPTDVPAKPFQLGYFIFASIYVMTVQLHKKTTDCIL
jgi:hypothetical protein